VRTGSLRGNMRFLGPEEGGVVAVSWTPGSDLVCIYASGAISVAASPSEGGFEGAEGSRYSGTKGLGVSLVSPANMGFFGLLHLSLHLEAVATLAPMFSLGGAIATWAD
jgi:hypothetical protein